MDTIENPMLAVEQLASATARPPEENGRKRQTNPLLAPLQMRWPGGSTIDTPPSNCPRHVVSLRDTVLLQSLSSRI